MLRWRMLRQGAHQVKSASLSGSCSRADVVQAARVEDALEQRALVGPLADGAVVALLGVHVDLGARATLRSPHRTTRSPVARSAAT